MSRVPAITGVLCCVLLLAASAVYALIAETTARMRSPPTSGVGVIFVGGASNDQAIVLDMPNIHWPVRAPSVINLGDDGSLSVWPPRTMFWRGGYRPRPTTLVRVDPVIAEADQRPMKDRWVCVSADRHVRYGEVLSVLRHLQRSGYRLACIA